MNAILDLCDEGEALVVRPIDLSNIEHIVGASLRAGVLSFTSIEIDNRSHHSRLVFIEAPVFAHFQMAPISIGIHPDRGGSGCSGLDESAGFRRLPGCPS